MWWKSNRNVAYKKNLEQADYKVESDNTFISLKKLLDESFIDLPKPLPRMSAGVFGYIGYDNVYSDWKISYEYLSKRRLKLLLYESFC